MGSTTKWDDVPIPSLWGVTEVSSHLNVTTSNLDRVMGLPPARLTTAAGRFWLRDEIQEFAAARNKERAAARRREQRRKKVATQKKVATE